MTDRAKYGLEQRQLQLYQHKEEMEILRQQLQKKREELDEIMNDIQNKQDILKCEKDQMEKIRVVVQREKDTEGYWITQHKEEEGRKMEHLELSSAETDTLSSGANNIMAVGSREMDGEKEI